MSEAIIARGGKSGSLTGENLYNTTVYLSDSVFVVPFDAQNNEFSVRLFGGGDGAYGRGGTCGVEIPLFGGGSGGRDQNGADGICIIQYYKNPDKLNKD